MNYIYPAVFYPEDDGKYSVIFPDLNDLATYGDNLADAFAMAQEACGQYLFTSLRDGEVLPAPNFKHIHKFIITQGRHPEMGVVLFFMSLFFITARTVHARILRRGKGRRLF